MEVETDVVSNTDGSARVSLVKSTFTCERSAETVSLFSFHRASQGHTAVLVGIKAEIGKPRPLVPDEGYLEFFVDW